jgi:hypothetical protein
LYGTTYIIQFDRGNAIGFTLNDRGIDKLEIGSSIHEIADRKAPILSIPHVPMISAKSSQSSKLSTRSPPPSPAKIAMADVANIFIKLRRTREKSKSHHIDSSSGEPQTHPSLTGDGVTCAERVDIELNENYVCVGAVDVVKLLRCSRTKLFEKASFWNANVLIDEQYVVFGVVPPIVYLTSLFRWDCTICGPKHRRDGTFRVHVGCLRL